MEEKLRNQLHEILDIVIQTNGFNQRQRTKTGTLPTVFFYYSGHVNTLSIDLHADGWAPSQGLTKRWDLSFDKPISDNVIETIRREMEAALSEKKESDVLRRDIDAYEKELIQKKKNLSEMKKELKKMERKGK